MIFLPIRVRPLPLFLSLVDVELSLSAAAAPSAVAVVPYNQKPFEHLQRKEATAKEEEEAIVATTRITCAPEPRTDLNACFAPSQSNRHLLPFLFHLRVPIQFHIKPSTLQKCISVVLASRFPVVVSCRASRAVSFRINAPPV